MQCLVVVLFFLAAAASGKQTLIQPINLTLCNESSQNVTRFMTDVFVVQPQQHESCSITNTSTPVLFRVTNTVPDNMSSPVVFVARSQKNVQTWQLPLHLPEFSQKFYSVERTLCNVPPLSLSRWGQEEGEVIIDVFTSSTSGENYTIEVTPVEDAELNLDEPAQLEVSVNSPVVRYFKFSHNISMVKVHAESGIDDTCFVVSVQKAACPVDVIPQDGLPDGGAYQTMLNKATLPVTKDLIKTENFFVVVMVTNSSACSLTINSTEDSYEKSYTVNITITELKDAGQYVFILSVPVIVLIGPIIVTLVLFCLPSECFCCCSRILESYSPLKRLCDKYNCHPCHCIVGDDGNGDEGERENLIPPKPKHVQKGQSVLPSVGLSLHTDGTPPNPYEKSERKLRLADMLQIHVPTDCTETLESQYKVYGWNAITVGIFYGLPALQFVLGQQLIVYATGYQELCYYNFECAHPAGVLSAFNNIWSNIGYVMLGLTFLGVVGIRHYRDRKHMKENKEYFLTHGVPQFYGMYYAMGVALILEGFMSSFYHICPSGFNFQFDTAFMFIIGGLLTVKILQARHPAINANAFVAFFCFAVIILLTLIGIYESRVAPLSTRIVLLTLVMIFMVIFSMSFYYFHDWKMKQLIECGKVLKWIKDTFTSWPKHKVRLVRLIIATVTNLLVGIGLVAANKGVPTIVLGLFITNFLSFLLSYLFCKVVLYKEPWTPAALLNLLLLGGFWIAALVFYFSGVTDWAKSPAESRDLNKHCLLFGFYDNHDVWHFLSACGMFCSFLFVLTLDDGLRDTPTKDIHVF